MVLRLATALGLLVCGSGEPTVIFRSNFTEPPWVAIYHVRLNSPIYYLSVERFGCHLLWISGALRCPRLSGLELSSRIYLRYADSCYDRSPPPTPGWRVAPDGVC